MTVSKRKCSHENCGSPPMHDADYCFVHNPASKSAHLAATAKGGRNAHKEMSVEEAQRMLAKIARRLLKGKMTARDASAATCALRSVIHAAEVVELQRTNDLIERKTDDAKQSQ